MVAGLWLRSLGLWLSLFGDYDIEWFLLVLDSVGNFCFGTPVLFMRAGACVALSGWQVKSSRQDNTRKYLGRVVYKKRVPRVGQQLAGSPSYNLIGSVVIVD